MFRQLRRRAGIPKSRMHARAAPPAVYHRSPVNLGCESAALVAAVVVMVSVAVAAPELVTLTGEVEPKLKVGGNWFPAGPDATEAVIVTLPVNPPLGVSVTVEVLPVVAPGMTDTFVPVRARPGGAVVTLTNSPLLSAT